MSDIESVYISPSGVRSESAKPSHHFGNQGKAIGNVPDAPLPKGSHTILVPFDGSSSSKAALEHAFALSTPKDHLLILHDQHKKYRSTGYYGEIEPVLDESEKRQSEALLNFTKESCKAANRDCEWVLHGIMGGSSSVAHDIAQVAEERKVDQVVMGSRGWSSALGLGVSIGSVSTGVLQRANCPVTLVKEDKGEERGSVIPNPGHKGGDVAINQPLTL